MRRALPSLLVAGLLASTWMVVQSARGDGSDGYVEAAALGTGLREPAAVAVLEDGGIAVADYSAGAVTVFEPDGEVRWVFDHDLDHPSGLAADPAGVWVTDTANARVLFLMAKDGSLSHAMGLDPELRPTDVALSGAGAVWVSCTPDDVLLLLDAAGDVVVVVDEVGDEPLVAPRGLLEDGEGGVYVTAALDGYVAHYDRSGALLEVIGEWGLAEGQFVKPKDLTRLPDGRFAVLDTHQGIIQIIEPDGTFVRVAADEAGVHVFEHGLGIAASGDTLYVADAGSAEIRVLEAGGQALNGGRFTSREVLYRSVSVLDQNPSQICRQCHDGTRRLSAGNFDPAARNHPIQVEDEDDIIPPFIARNADGSLKCTSCHQLHAQDADAHDGFADVVDFGLHAKQERTLESPQVCLDCHGSYVESALAHERRSHPVGLPLPEDALEDELTGIRSRLDNGNVTCMSCHRPHGALDDPLLIAPAGDGTLCKYCHVSHGGSVSHHPLDMDVPPHVAEKVQAMGGSLGVDGKLTCLSCHDPHQSTAGTLLRTSAEGGSPCGTCHDEKASEITAGAHGRVGCASCHGMHQPPQLVDIEADDTGLDDADEDKGPRLTNIGPQACLDCHTTGRAETPQIVVSGSHPLGRNLGTRSGGLPTLDGFMACTTCHAAHGSGFALLNDGIPDICLRCHGDKKSVLGTDHDAAVVPAGGSNQTCLSCHRVHGPGRARFLLPIKDRSVNPASARCLRCHDGSTRATNQTVGHHPSVAERSSSGLPTRYDGTARFYTPDGQVTHDLKVGQPACVTCHDPHRWRHDATERPGAADGDASTSFLRDPTEVLTLCSKCHGTEAATRRKKFHDEDYRATLEVW